MIHGQDQNYYDYAQSYRSHGKSSQCSIERSIQQSYLVDESVKSAPNRSSKKVSQVLPDNDQRHSPSRPDTRGLEEDVDMNNIQLNAINNVNLFERKNPDDQPLIVMDEHMPPTKIASPSRLQNLAQNSPNLEVNASPGRKVLSKSLADGFGQNTDRSIRTQKSNLKTRSRRDSVKSSTIIYRIDDDPELKELFKSGDTKLPEFKSEFGILEAINHTAPGAKKIIIHRKFVKILDEEAKAGNINGMMMNGEVGTQCKLITGITLTKATILTKALKIAAQISSECEIDFPNKATLLAGDDSDIDVQDLRIRARSALIKLAHRIGLIQNGENAHYVRADITNMQNLDEETEPYLSAIIRDTIYTNQANYNLLGAQWL